jgi:hypothetical protein
MSSMAALRGNEDAVSEVMVMEEKARVQGGSRACWARS